VTSCARAILNRKQNRPVTLAGCAALLRYLEAQERSYGRVALLDNHNHAKIPARDLLSRIAAMLDASVQS
jgi:hypothetical protein